ncbi:SIMPL domain-containing protein [Methylocella sp. CPCC 101449]|uniref:SIMPL domain-containing protein n=1 Tax=Methylocella sp. CPCC 101449 TaxID=2987531 RepID=UPI00288E6197|nr:SIMPL domain-containing protein [Methylocella sp. CPCC 101449]MDT2019683.1 SIMPL domain-containing protein [Methylocella sp. CPCC 101449]
MKGISMKLKPFSIAALAFASWAAIATGASAQQMTLTKDSLPQITTTGTARATDKPDQATIYLGIRVEKPTAKEAADEASKASKSFLSDLRGQGVTDADIKTQQSQVAPIFDQERAPNGNMIRKQRGFMAMQSFSVRVRDVAKAGDVARRALQNGANIFNGVNFELANPKARRIALGAEAAKVARTEAEAYANAMGLKLGRIMMMQPADGGPHYAAAPAAMRMKADAGGAEETPIPLEPGEVETEAAMSVTWELVAN